MICFYVYDRLKRNDLQNIHGKKYSRKFPSNSTVLDLNYWISTQFCCDIFNVHIFSPIGIQTDELLDENIEYEIELYINPYTTFENEDFHYLEDKYQYSRANIDLKFFVIVAIEYDGGYHRWEEKINIKGLTTYAKLKEITLGIIHNKFGWHKKFLKSISLHSDYDNITAGHIYEEADEQLTDNGRIINHHFANEFENKYLIIQTIFKNSNYTSVNLMSPTGNQNLVFFNKDPITEIKKKLYEDIRRVILYDLDNNILPDEQVINDLTNVRYEILAHLPVEKLTDSELTRYIKKLYKDLDHDDVLRKKYILDMGFSDIDIHLVSDGKSLYVRKALLTLLVVKSVKDSLFELFFCSGHKFLDMKERKIEIDVDSALFRDFTLGDNIFCLDALVDYSYMDRIIDMRISRIKQLLVWVNYFGFEHLEKNLSLVVNNVFFKEYAIRYPTVQETSDALEL